MSLYDGSEGSEGNHGTRRRVEEWVVAQNTDAELPELRKRWLLHVYSIKDLHRAVAFKVLGEHRGVYNLDENPLWFVDARGAFRIKVISIIDRHLFDTTILIMIVLNCVAELLDTPTLRDFTWAPPIRFWSETFFLLVFVTEAMLKVIAMGFALHRKAYIRDPWNAVDFMILVSSGLTIFLSKSGSFSILRFVRIIRPMRAIRRVKGLRVLIISITSALPLFLDVLMLLFLIMFMFSVLGLQLWKGKMHQRCYAYPTTVPVPFPILVANETQACGHGRPCGSLGPNYKVDCEIRTDIFRDTVTNYDNIGTALFQVAVIVSLDNWPAEMHNVQNASSTWAWLYFVTLTLVGGYFLLDMVVAVLSVSYADTHRCMSGIKHVVVDPAKIGISPMTHGVYRHCTPKYSNYKQQLMFSKRPDEKEPATTSIALRAEQRVQKYFGVHKYQEEYQDYVMAENEKKREMEAWGQKVSQLQEIITAEHILGGLGRSREVEERLIPTTLRVDNLMGEDVLHMLLALACPYAIVPAPQLPKYEDSSDESVPSSLRCGSDTSEEPTAVMKFVANPIFGYFMLGVTIVSVIAMATDYEGISHSHAKALDIISFAMTGFFIIEAVLKLVGLGLKGYIADRLNIVDFVVLLISIPDLFLENTGVAALRAFRVLRLLGHMSDSQKHLLRAIGEALPEIGSLLFLEILLIFMFSLLGISLFEARYPQGSRENFDSIWESVLTVFIMLTGDGWAKIAKEGMRATTMWASIYFISFFLLGTVIAMSMFPAILIDRMTDEVRRKKKAQQLEAMRQIDEMGLSMHPSSLSEVILKQHEAEQTKATKWKIASLAAGTAMAAHRKVRGEVNAKELLGNWTAEISLKHNRPFWMNKLTGRKEWSNPVVCVEDTTTEQDINPGTPVEVWWCGEWYNGTVLGRREDGTYSVAYINTGDVQVGVHPHYIRLRRTANNPLLPLKVASEIQELGLKEIFTLPDLGGMTLLWCALSAKGKKKLEGVWEDPERRKVLLGWLAKDGTLMRTPQPRMDEPVNPLEMVFPKKVKIVVPIRSEDVSIEFDNKGLGGCAAAVCDSRNNVQVDETSTSLYSEGRSARTARLRSMRLGNSSENSDPGKQPNRTIKKSKMVAGRSLGFFTRKSKIRQFISSIVLHKWFDDVMLTIIFINAIFLGLDDYYAENRPGGRKLLNTANIIFVVIYLSEMVAKIITLGLYKAPNAYFRSTWNRIDAVVALAQIIELAKLGVGTQLRGARTIRLLVRIHEVRVVCEMLLKVLPDVIKVGLVYGLVWLIFGVIGVAVFKGQLSGCNDPSILNETACVGMFNMVVGDMWSTTATRPTPREWSNYRVTFDNIGETALTLLELASLEDWSSLMWRVVDANKGSGPVKNAHPERALYFVSYVIVAHFFLIALFIGTLVNAFHASQHRASALLTVKQRLWSRTHRLISATDLEWKPKVPLKHEWNGIKLKCFYINANEKFDIIIYTLIGLNCLMLATATYEMSARQEHILHVGNIIFVIIFIIEAMIRWIALGFKGYMRDPWNRFDLFCITTSVAGLVLSLNTTVIRVARVVRGVRLLRKADRLKGLIYTLSRSLPALFNVSLLLLYIFFNWGIVGVSMFKNVKPNPHLTNHSSFKTLPSAMLILYQIATTETWTDIIEGTSIQPPECEEAAGNCGNRVGSILYFSSAMVVGSFIFLNLFIYVVLENFIETRKEMVGLANDEFFGAFKLFKSLWTEADPSLTRKVSVDEFLSIVQQLPEPLWTHGKNSQSWLTLLHNVKALPIPVSLDREVSFDDCVMALAMRAIRIHKKDAAAVGGTLDTIRNFFDPHLFTLEHIIAARRIEYYFYRWKTTKQLAEINKEKKKFAKASAALGVFKL